MTEVNEFSPSRQGLGCKSLLSHKSVRRLGVQLLGDKRAATAVETAFLLPVFILLIFGIIEVGILLLYYMYLSTAANAGVDYLRRAAAEEKPATEVALRQAIASNFIAPTDQNNLKIALLPIPDDDIAEALVTIPITNNFRPPTDKAGQYILAIGYNWDFVMPTTSLLIPSTEGVHQLRNISLAITAVKVTE